MRTDLEKDEFEVLNYIDVYKTVSNKEEIVDSTTLDSEMVEIILMNLKERGFLENSWEITPQGEDIAQEYRRNLLEESERREEILELCDKFEEINDTFKRFVTEHQKESAQAPSNEEDQIKKIEKFSDIHEETIDILKKLSNDLPMLNMYIEKFDHSYENILGGKWEYLVEKDHSYHDLWFEVHETLLNLQEKERVE